MRYFFISVLILVVMVTACQKPERADNLQALTKGQAEKPAGMPQMDLEELKKCCDDDARAMGAECCVLLDKFKEAHSGTGGNQMGQMPAMPDSGSFKTVRPVNVAPEVVAAWPRVKLMVGPKDKPGQEVIIEVGKKVKVENTPLEIEVLNFLPAFKMNDQGITSSGNEPENPAAKVVIRESGKPDWTGWLFEKMPDVHAFAHPDYKVLLLEGIKKGQNK